MSPLFYIRNRSNTKGLPPLIASKVLYDRLERDNEKHPDGEDSYSFQDQSLDFYEKLKMAFGAFLLIPLRLILGFPLMLAGGFLTFISNPLLFNSPASNTPMSRWDRFCLLCIRALTRAFLFANGFYWIDVKNGLDPSSRILVSNHVSIADIPLMLYLAGPSFISKQSLEDVPFIGLFGKFLRCVFVDRHSTKSREKAKAIISRRAFENGTKGSTPPILIFAESTTTNGKCLIPFKQGAFNDGRSVQPITIQYPFEHFNPAYTSIHKDKAGGLVETSSLFYLWRFMSQFRHRVEVTFLPPREPSDSEKLFPKVYCQNVRAEMAATLTVPQKSPKKLYY